MTARSAISIYRLGTVGRLPICPRRNFSAIRTHVLPGKRMPLAKYGGRHTCAMLTGDGIGPEMLEHIKRIFEFAHMPVDFETIRIGSADPGNDILNDAIVAVQRNGIAIKGNIETKFDDPIFSSRNVELRRRLDLYANVLHCVSIPSIPSHHKDLDLVLIRENTEGEYSGLEHEAVQVTRRNITRIARFAFEYAMLNDRKRIVAIHKANIQKLADGLFLKVCREMAENEYKEVEFESMIVDNASMQLVSRPQQFNGSVLLMPNLYGNIISNIACGLVGGPGLVSGMNIGDKHAVFETGTRNTGTSLAGKNLANPTAFVRSAVDMLRYLELHDRANKLSDALYKAINEQKKHTADVGGSCKTSEVIEAIIENLRATL